MVFTSIGWTTALMLNRLRCEAQISEVGAAKDQHLEKQKNEQKEARAELARVNERLAKLAATADKLRRQRD